MAGLPKQTPWRDIVRKFRALGWTGPVFGGPHPIMRKGPVQQRIPNSHDSPIHVSLLADLLRKAGISHDDWNAA
jgi:hypothetical protein